jgi:hypothetical protein
MSNYTTSVKAFDAAVVQQDGSVQTCQWQLDGVRDADMPVLMGRTMAVLTRCASPGSDSMRSRSRRVGSPSQSPSVATANAAASTARCSLAGMSTPSRADR